METPSSTDLAPAAVDERQRFVSRGAPIIHDTIDNETIAINQLTGAYYTLEGPSALAWQLLATGASALDVARRLGSEYDADAATLETEAVEFFGLLMAEGLIVPTSGAADPAASASAASGAPAPTTGNAAAARSRFAGLALQRYSDLEVLLLADPIHEVDDTGWPMPLADRAP
jgi:hypothetical protein